MATFGEYNHRPVPKPTPAPRPKTKVAPKKAAKGKLPVRINNFKAMMDAFRRKFTGK